MPSALTTPRAPRPLLLTAALALAFAASPATVQAAGGHKRPAASKSTKKTTREKALLNMVEQPSFPNEDVDRKALVVAPKIQRTRGRKPAAPPTRQQLSATGELVSNETPPPPAPAAEPTPAPAPAAAAPPPAPKEPPKPKVTAETASRIDSIIGKAFVEPPPEAPAVHAAAPSTQLAPDKIAAAMKPVSTAVKKACPFGERGVVTLRFEVGAAGRIDKVTPEGPLANRPQTACVVDAAMKAKLVGASQTSFRYPFPVK
jgi:hypothetical protein